MPRMRMTARVVVVVTAATMIAGLAACGGDDAATGAPGTASATSTTPAAASPTPRATDANGFPLPERPACAAESGGEFVRATTSEGNSVGMLILGEGESGVVLGPQDGGDICMMLAYGEELATRYRVALYDWKEPRWEVPLLAVQALRDAGADRVVLGGASYGGALAMSVAHRARPPLAGVLSLGGGLRLPGEDFRPGIRRWRGPLLEISSKQDAYFDSADARRLRALHPGPETVLMLPGSLHGVDLLEGPAAGAGPRHGRRVPRPRPRLSGLDSAATAGRRCVGGKPLRQPDRHHRQHDQHRGDHVDDRRLVRPGQVAKIQIGRVCGAGPGGEGRHDDLVEGEREGEQRRRPAAPTAAAGR